MVEVIDGLHAVTLHVRDPKNVRTFYRDVLGLKEITFDEQAHRAVYALPGTETLLTMHVQAPGEGGREPGTVSGVVLRAKDPRAACAEIQRRGGQIVVEPNDVEAGGHKFVRAVIADPDGNEFVLSNRKD
jgi:predicted enzyme related to lactoylglutathione lyase